jgi:hypothetical protein
LQRKQICHNTGRGNAELDRFAVREQRKTLACRPDRVK